MSLRKLLILAGTLSSCATPAPRSTLAPLPVADERAGTSSRSVISPPIVISPSIVVSPPIAVGSGLRFLVEPADATILVDGRAVGSVAELAGRDGVLAIPPGSYAIVLTRSGYATWRLEVLLESGIQTLNVRMERLQ